MAIFYFIHRIVAAETIEVGKLFKGGNYLRKYGICLKKYTNQKSKQLFDILADEMPRTFLTNI